MYSQKSAKECCQCFLPLGLVLFGIGRGKSYFVIDFWLLVVTLWVFKKKSWNKAVSDIVVICFQLDPLKKYQKNLYHGSIVLNRIACGYQVYCYIPIGIVLELSMITESSFILTLLGWAWMDRAVLTDNTLKRNGSCPWNVSLTLEPKHAGYSAIHCPSVLWDILLSLIRASPFGWAPIQSCWKRDILCSYFQTSISG